MCCIPDGVQGCSDVDVNLCCDDLQCNTEAGMCVSGDINLDEYGRPVRFNRPLRLGQGIFLSDSLFDSVVSLYAKLLAVVFHPR